MGDPVASVNNETQIRNLPGNIWLKQFSLMQRLADNLDEFVNDKVQRAIADELMFDFPSQYLRNSWQADLASCSRFAVRSLIDQLP